MHRDSLMGFHDHLSNAACPFALCFSSSKVSRLSVNAGHQTRASRLSYHCIFFPVPDPASLICFLWSFGEFVADLHFSSAIFAVLPLSRLPFMPQVPFCSLAAAGVARLIEHSGVDRPIDGIWANKCGSFFLHPPRNLLRRPLFLQEQCLYFFIQFRLEQLLLGTAFFLRRSYLDCARLGRYSFFFFSRLSAPMELRFNSRDIVALLRPNSFAISVMFFPSPRKNSRFSLSVMLRCL